MVLDKILLDRASSQDLTTNIDEWILSINVAFMLHMIQYGPTFTNFEN